MKRKPENLSPTNFMKSIAFVCILCSLKVHSQEKIIRGRVLDENKKPVSYAAIGIAKTAYGTIADEQGNFVFYLPEKTGATDTLKVSCVGFSSTQVAVSKLPEFLEIILVGHLVGLPEVTVAAKNLETKIIGNTREDTFLNCNFAIGNKPQQNLGAEIGRKFFLKGKKYLIRKLNVYSRSNFDTTLFRLSVYSLKNGLPDKNLLNESIILKLVNPKIGWTAFDLETYRLVYDQNIVVALQWIGHSRKGKIVQLPITMPAIGAVHFYKFGSQDKWRRYNNMSTSINLEVQVEQ